MCFAQAEVALRWGRPWWGQMELKRHQLDSQGEYALALIAVRAIRWSAPAGARHKADADAGQPSLCAAWAVRYAAVGFRGHSAVLQGVRHDGSQVFFRGQPDQ